MCNLHASSSPLLSRVPSVPGSCVIHLRVRDQLFHSLPCYCEGLCIRTSTKRYKSTPSSTASRITSLSPHLLATTTSTAKKEETMKFISAILAIVMAIFLIIGSTVADPRGGGGWNRGHHGGGGGGWNRGHHGGGGGWNRGHHGGGGGWNRGHGGGRRW